MTAKAIDAAKFRYLASLFVILLAAGAVRAADTVSAKPFFEHSSYRELRLSPSGKFLGALVPAGGRVRLAIIDIDTKSVTIAGSLQGDDVDWFDWVNDERLVFSAIDLQSGLGEQRGGGLFAVNRDGKEFRILAPTLKAQSNQHQFVYRYTHLLALPRDGTDEILVTSNDPDARYPSVYRMDTRSGRKTLKTSNKPGDIVSWVADRKAVVRAAVEIDKGTTIRVYWRADEESKWIRLTETDFRKPTFLPVAFDGDGTLIVRSNMGRDTWAIYRYNVDERALGTELAAHRLADLTGNLVFDRSKNRIVGMHFQADRPGNIWFDDDWAKLQNSVDAALPGRMNLVTREGARALVLSYSDTDPGSYYLLDMDKRRMEFIASRRTAIDPKAMPTRTPVRYPARDGLEIPAYLTLPKEHSKPVPLVVLVHGGPYVHGATWGWSAEPAYIASLGYAVLEPAFRGSTGWGTKLYTAGWKQWGLAMQDDLNDGMDWLAKQGVIDPKRACIMGASYGGYATMMGLARDPDRWRCGINVVGVTDISLMFDVTWSDFAYSDFIRYSAKEMIGDPDTEATKLKAASPLENAAKIKVPVLMAYGAQDRRVPLVFGEKMRDALRAQGTPVEWQVYSDEAHGFLLESNRYDFYDKVAKFLERELAAH